MDEDGIPQDEPAGATPPAQVPQQQPQQQFPPQQAPQQGYPGAAPGPYGYMYPEQSQAMTALIISILGIAFCQILGPFGWSMANKELAAIDSGLRDPSKRDLANGARIVGIIGTVLLGLVVVFFAFFILLSVIGVFGAAVAGSTS